jgi:dihydropyrimidinase
MSGQGFDTVVRGGTLVTAADTFAADIGIRDGKIVALGTDLGPGAREVDATGRLVLPGGIDSHVHISQPQGEGVVMADDFESATRSALIGGNTTVMPFCLQQKGETLRGALTGYHALAEGNCYTDVSFHIIVSDPTAGVLGQELPALAREGYTSIKVFMTYENLRLRDDEILATLDAARRAGQVVLVHCENEDAIRYLIGRREAAGETAPYHHATSRPVAAEREATHRALSLAEIVETPIVIVHVSNREAMEEISRARMRGQKIAGETCPQYLVLTAEDLKSDDFDGAKYVCSPPPRDKPSQEACWQGLETGVFDLYSSDHCPFRFEDPQGKQTPKGKQSFRWIPNGIPGVATRLPILFSEGVAKGRIDLNRFVALTATNHAKLYGIYPQKGTIAVGSDADLAIWDPDAVRSITNDDLLHGADYTPYEGMTVTGWPQTVLLRGEVAVDNGRIVADKGRGRHLARGTSSLFRQTA